MKVVIIMGSKKDIEHSKKITEILNKLGVKSILRIASAHKTPLKVLEIIKEYEGDDVIFITVVGKSNALSGLVDAHTVKPVIASPLYSDKFGGADIFSSLRMPSGVCPMVVLEPEQAAIASAKILALSNKELKQKIKRFQKNMREKIEREDGDVMKRYG